MPDLEENSKHLYVYPLEKVYSSIMERNRAKRRDERSFMNDVRTVFSDGKFIRRINEPSKPSDSVRIGKQASQTRPNRLIGMLNQGILDTMRFSSSLFDVNPHLPSIRTSIRDYLIKGREETDTEERILGRVSAIFKYESGRVYKKFLYTIKRRQEVLQSVLDNMIERYSQKTGKKQMKFEIMHLNSETIKEITSYYCMDSQVKNAIISLHERYNKSLVDLIHDSYFELLRTPGIQN